MRLYLAGLFTNGFGNEHSTMVSRLTEIEDYYRRQVPWYLESYHYIGKPKYVNEIRKAGKKVFLDSGAFSAFTKGVRVDLPKYCRYIQENADIIDCASVLDSIGSAQGTYENQVAMERLGTKPLPCFHYGEDERYLQYYLANYEYITIGGMVPISTPQLRLWLDRIWNDYLIDGSGRPRIKVHGFGLTTMPLVERYPWYSVDSSSWVQSASNGSIIIPGLGMVAVSGTSPARKQEGRHFTTMTPQEQEVILARIHQIGFDMDRLRDEYLSRWAWNVWAYCEFNRIYYDADPTFKQDQMRLF